MKSPPRCWLSRIRPNAILMIKEAFEIAAKEFGYIPLHQQALAWGASKKVNLTQRADNQVLFYWATKQDD